MNLHTKHLLVAAATAVLCMGAATAQPATGAASAPMGSTMPMTTPMTTPMGMAASMPATAASGSRMLRSDANFMKQAAENGHVEVEGSKLALTKASSEEVKKYAQGMVDAHTKVGAELKALAASKGVQVSETPSTAQRAKMKLLERADGANFDKRYIDSVGIKAHEDTVKMFQKASTGARDPEIKAWAAKTLPDLQHHLQMARDLKASTDMAAKTASR